MIMGPNGSGKSTLSYVLKGAAAMKPKMARCGLTVPTCWIWSRKHAPLRACFWRSISDGNSGRHQYDVFTHGNKRGARARRSEMDPASFLRMVRENPAPWVSMTTCSSGPECRFSGGEKKRNEVLQMAVLSRVWQSRRDR